MPKRREQMNRENVKRRKRLRDEDNDSDDPDFDEESDAEHPPIMNRGSKRMRPIYDIPKLPFSRVVREVAQTYEESYKFQESAIQALQEAAEAFLLVHFVGSKIAMLHAKRKTLMISDMKLDRQLRIDHL